MTSHFLETLTLATLIEPIGETEFRARHWEKTPLLVQRGRPDFYGDLFTLQDFDHLVANAPAYVKIAEAKSKKNVKHEGATSSGLERVLADMQSGSTLVLDSAHQREPKLSLLCRLLEKQLGYHFQTNLYLTPPSGQGFTPHWDNHDVFILQVFGSKHWKIERQRRVFPSKGENMGDEGRVIGPDAHSFTLAQGDVVYIPRGFVHAAECGSEPSLHITLGIHPPTWDELLHTVIKAAVIDDERLRRSLPLGFLREDNGNLVKGVAAVLKTITDEKFLNAVVDRYKDELVTKSTLDISGQVAAFFQATELNVEDRVGPRPGIVYRTHSGDETIRINFGGRSITFPDFFKEPIDFALNTTSYTIRDIAGDLEDSEKIVFVERLMQEGLVVRK